MNLNPTWETRLLNPPLVKATEAFQPLRPYPSPEILAKRSLQI